MQTTFSASFGGVAGAGLGSTNYADWKLANGVPTPETVLDIDGDTRENLHEYVEGTSPAAPDVDSRFSLRIQAVNVSGVIGDCLVFRYRRVLGTDDFLIRPELSDDLTIWAGGAGARVVELR